MEISIYSSKIVIENYTENPSSRLEKVLSVWDTGLFKYTHSNFIRQDNDLIIPVNFDIHYLRKLYPDVRINYRNNEFDKARSVVFKAVVEPKDDYQRDCIDFMLSSGSYENEGYKHNKMVCLKTGGGKTFCTIYTLSKIKKRCIVIVDKDKIMDQWKSEFLKFTSLDERDIYCISGSDTIESLLNKKIKNNYRVFIASHRTLSSYANNKGWDKIGELFKTLELGVKVYDEAHVEFKNIFYIDSYTNVDKTFYLTATPGRSNNEENKVYGMSFKNITKYGLEDKFKDLYHYIYYISYDSKPNLKEQALCKNKYGFSINNFSDYVFNNEDNYVQFLSLNRTFIDMCFKYNPNGKLAIIIHKIEHVEKLKKDLEQFYPDKSIGCFCSLIKNREEREKELDKQIIISTDKSLGKAVDIKDLQFLIMTVPTSSKIVAEQVLGRLRRIEGKKVFYFDLTDVGFKSCIAQRNQRKQVLDKKAVKIKSLNL